jgi:hypothetical protein
MAATLVQRFEKAVKQNNHGELKRLADSVLSAEVEQFDYKSLARASLHLANAQDYHLAFEFAQKAIARDGTKIEAPELLFWICFNTRNHDQAAETLRLIRMLEASKPREDVYDDWEIIIAHAKSETDVVRQLFEKRGKLPSPDDDSRFMELSFAYVKAFAPSDLDKVEQWINGLDHKNMVTNPYGVMALVTFLIAKGDNYAAVQVYRDALDGPLSGTPEIVWNLSLLEVGIGDPQGWRRYWNRWEFKGFPSPERKFSSPRWTPEYDLQDKSILIWGEQGLGDEIQFLTRLPYLFPLGPKKITLEVNKKIVPLVARWFPFLEVRPHGRLDCSELDEYRGYDFHMPMGDLPCWFSEKLPVQKAMYLDLSNEAEPIKDEYGKFFSKTLPVIGLSWRSGVTNAARNDSYMNANAARDLAKGYEGRLNFVSLQYGLTDEEKAILADQPNIYVPDADFFGDILLHAQYVSACDLVVVALTSAFQLAGVTFTPCISWIEKTHMLLEGGNDKAWYDTIHFIKTERKYDRGALLYQIGKRLDRMV